MELFPTKSTNKETDEKGDSGDVERTFLYVVARLIERVIYRVFGDVDMSVSMFFDVFDYLSRISFQSIGIVEECFAGGGDFIVCHRIFRGAILLVRRKLSFAAVHE